MSDDGKWTWTVAGLAIAISIASICINQCHRAKAEQVGETTSFEVKNTESKLSISTVTAPAAHSVITFYSATDKKVIIHADGRVEWEGDLDAATFLFWTRVSQAFPGFKKAICEDGK